MGYNDIDDVDSPSHETIEFFDHCATGLVEITDIVQVAMSVWYKKTVMECGQIESCWSRKIRKSADLPPSIKATKQRQKVTNFITYF